ncbi:MAG: gas vesicle protein GvpG [Armatimonadetes bacterium]|nr:gas vesicle protein GvpG [Armatimonadota bacterium]
MDLLMWVGKNIHQAVLTEMLDETAIRNDLMALQSGLEEGELDEETYLAREADIVKRLREIRALKAELEGTENDG